MTVTTIGMMRPCFTTGYPFQGKLNELIDWIRVWIRHWFELNGWLNRSGPRQSVGRRFHQRPAVAQPHPIENRRIGGGRRPSVRHFATIEGIARMRVENSQPVPRDGQHPGRSAGRHSTQTQSPSGYPAPHPILSQRKSRYLFLGSSRQVRLKKKWSIHLTTDD